MDLESRLIALALAEGRITPEDLGAVSALHPDATTAEWGFRIDALVASGHLDRSWVDQNTRALMSPADGEEDPGWDILTSPGLPSSMGRYKELKLVAVGGQGRVYRARDTLLDREVALKFLRWDSPLQRDWLLREGRAQAKVAHPGICPVHEVGELGGETFLALTWVEGPSLREALPDLNIPERLELLLQTCEAVHAAHVHGLVHLDLKPGNLLLERQSGGQLRVRVSDFGLAWRAGEAPLGRVGTPPYASPEQLQGGLNLPGPTSDVYALGVLMYQVLTGRLPHEAGPSRLGSDAARAFAKATALDPTRRYADARSMALDLQALRDARPLPGLRNSPWHRARLWTLRHRVGAAALAVGLACLALGSGQVLRLRLQARTQARLAQRFGQDIQRVESLLRLSHMSPPHDLRPTLAQVRDMMQGIRLAMQGLSPEAQGEGWYALGRAHQLLGEDREALKALEKAWTQGTRSPECAEALGLARAEAYLGELQSLGVDLGRTPVNPAVAELRRQYALPAVDLLARAAKEKPDIARALGAVRADIEGRTEDAERLAAEALESPTSQPWEVLPWRILVHYWEYRGQLCIGRNDLDGARSQLARARSALDRVAQAARSDPSLGLTEGWLCLTEAYILELEGHILPSEARLDRAVAAFAGAAELQPDMKVARKYILEGLRRKVTLRRNHHLPAQANLEEALSALKAASAEDVGDEALRYERRRILHEAVLVAWGTGSPLDCPEVPRYRADLKADLAPESASLALAELDVECAREQLRRKSDARAFLDSARAPLAQSYEKAPWRMDRLGAWVDWCLADAEAQLQAGAPVDTSRVDALAADIEARIRQSGPSMDMGECLRALRRMQVRVAKKGKPVRVPSAPGP